MTLNEYQLAAARTCPDLGSEKLNIAHMIMGIVSELEELMSAVKKRDIINIGEELADQEWYLSNYCRFYGIAYEDLFDHVSWSGASESALLLQLTKTISKLTDFEKKKLAYNKEVLQEIRKEACDKVIQEIMSLYNFFNLDRYKCLENNINKLKIRFPDKFSEENAINRNLKAERIELEK